MGGMEVSLHNVGGRTSAESFSEDLIRFARSGLAELENYQNCKRQKDEDKRHHRTFGWLNPSVSLWLFLCQYFWQDVRNDKDKSLKTKRLERGRKCCKNPYSPTGAKLYRFQAIACETYATPVRAGS